MNVGPVSSEDNDIIQRCDKQLKSQNCWFLFEANVYVKHNHQKSFCNGLGQEKRVKKFLNINLNFQKYITPL